MACSSTCLTCKNLSTQCLSCPSATFRQLVGSACLCQNGYFDDGSLVCSLCDPKCETCASSSTNCLSCNASQLTVLSGNICVCMVGAYTDPIQGLCVACHFSCSNCSSAGSSSCLTCFSTSNRHLTGSSCACNNGFFDQGVRICAPCHQNCLTCTGGPSQYNCTSCKTGFALFTSTCLPVVSCVSYYFEGQCVSSCPNYTYPLGKECKQCTNNCYTCLNATACTSCVHGTYLSPTMSCSSACSSGQYLNGSRCVNCPGGCITCTMDVTGIATCTSCLPTQYFYKGSCLSTCPSRTAVAQNGSCLDCVFPCATCTNLSSESCLTCSANYYLLGSNCLSPCPTGMYGSSLTLNCENCPSNCTQCHSITNFPVPECVACVYPLYPSFGVCMSIGTFNNNGVIGICHPNCLTCTNSSFSSCVRCKALRGDSSKMAIKGYCDCT